MFGALFVALLLASQTVAPQNGVAQAGSGGGGGGRAGAIMSASPSGQDTVFEMGAHGYRADGHLATTASSTSTDTFSGYMFSSDTPCSFGASDNEPSTDPVVGWHVNGRVLQRTDDGWDVEFDWQRIWSGHKRLVDGPRGSQRVTFRSGDRVSLDSVTFPPTDSCNVVIVRLEATIVSRPGRSAVAAMSVGGGGGRGGAGGGAAVGTSGGMIARIPSTGGIAARPTGGGTASAGGGSGGGAAAGAVAGSASGSSGSVMRFVPGPPAPISNLPLLVYELWLVHVLPGGNEDAQHQQITATPMGGAFLFQPITIGTSQGEATVRVTGSISVATDVSGEKQLRVIVSREVIGGNRGSAIKASPMPGPNDVLSFEIPALTVGQPPTPITSDPLSVRVRITPVPPK